MPKAVDHATANTVFSAEGCYDLHATVIDGHVFTIWELSQEDRTRIAMGENIRVCIKGPVYPIRVDLTNDPV